MRSMASLSGPVVRAIHRSGAAPQAAHRRARAGDRIAATADRRPAIGSTRPWSETRRGVRTALLIAATAVCMVLALLAVDLGAVGEALGGVDPRHVALAVVLLLCNALVAMARFRVLLGGFGYSPAWQRLVAAFSVGLLGNQFVLNFLGQSLGRAGVLVSSGVPFGATVIATFFERLLAAVLLGVPGLIAGWYLLPHFGLDFSHGGAYFVSLVGGMTLAAAVAGVAVSRRGTAARAVAVATRGVRRFWPVALLTIVAHCFMLGSYVAALFALGHGTLTPEIVAAAIIVTFAAGLPFSLGGWGIRELSAVAAFGAIGVDPPMALAAGLLVGVCSFVVNLAVACPGLLLLPGRIPESLVKVDPASPDWDARLVAGCAALAAMTIFFQTRVQVGGSLVTANVADLLALIGLGSLLLLVIRSRERFSGLPRPMVAAMVLLSLLFAYGLLLGYANFGATSWALLNRGFGWLVILGYVALGLAVAMLDAERAHWLILRVLVAAGDYGRRLATGLSGVSEARVSSAQGSVYLANGGVCLQRECFRVPDGDDRACRDSRAPIRRARVRQALAGCRSVPDRPRDLLHGVADSDRDVCNPACSVRGVRFTGGAPSHARNGPRRDGRCRSGGDGNRQHTPSRRCSWHRAVSDPASSVGGRLGLRSLADLRGRLAVLDRATNLRSRTRCLCGAPAWRIGALSGLPLGTDMVDGGDGCRRPCRGIGRVRLSCTGCLALDARPP